MRAPFLLLLIAVCAAGEPPAIQLIDAFPKVRLDRPLWFAELPDHSGRGLAIEQAGRMQVFPMDGSAAATLWLDIEAQTLSKGNEEGLLAAAFHPEVLKNGRLFLWQSRNLRGKRHNVLTEMKVGVAGGRIGAPDPATERELLAIPDFASNHNGGTLLFGADGMLYLSTGDGGGGGDPERNGQNLGSLLAKILRLDVDHQDPGLAYAVPKDNPFVGRAGVRGEVWAWGLRNVWRMSFDPPTGDLWAGDVGQNAREEIDVIVKGGNYGWSQREGAIAHKDGAVPAGAIEPVVDYGRQLGGSVTGGYVYRGKAHPALQGIYFYADYASGRVWGLQRVDGKVSWNAQVGTAKRPASFGIDAAGELYICQFDGSIRRIATR